MIARIWQGKTHQKHYETYTEFTRHTAIPDYSGIPGFIKLSFLRRLEGAVAHYMLITYWENEEAIKQFAGEEVLKAKYYPEDDQYLLDFPEKVIHFEVFAEQNGLFNK